jgi:hypothetical protein
VGFLERANLVTPGEPLARLGKIDDEALIAEMVHRVQVTRLGRGPVTLHDLAI